MLHDIVVGCVFDSPPLTWADGFPQILGLIGRSGFDFNEHNRAIVNADKIDLTGGATVIAGQDAIPPPREIACGGALPAHAKTLSIVTPRSPPAQVSEFLS